jgi:hypothetical protein
MGGTMSTPTLPAYHVALNPALTALSNHLLEREIVLKEEGSLESPYHFDGIPYGTHKSAHAEILTIKGKTTRKWGHVTIWRETNGRYEINFYVL